jgi:hypothetical protein
VWIAQVSATIPYTIIVIQMLMMGSGIGSISTPATESILSVLPPAKAGVGSAVNDATRETGGALGVAVIGSVYTSLYVSQLAAGARPPTLGAGDREGVGGSRLRRRAPRARTDPPPPALQTSRARS